MKNRLADFEIDDDGDDLVLDWAAGDIDDETFDERVSALPKAESEAIWRRKKLLAKARWFLEPWNDGSNIPIPERIDRYAIRRLVGRGGMGVVYEAYHEELACSVALKVIAPGVALGSWSDRLKQEARVLAQLKHQHIVPVYDAGTDRSHAYFTMEYVPAGTLADHLERVAAGGPQKFVAVMRKIAGGVAAAHRQGVLHRDLKPSNVLLKDADEPLVADFGLAKLADDLPANEMPPGLAEWTTRRGNCPGTPPYMAPEQFTADFGEVGPRTDVWALGAMLFELATGSKPFPGPVFVDYRRQVCEEPLVLAARLARTPRRIRDVILRCLSRNQGERFADAGELEAALATCLPPAKRLHWATTAAWCGVLVIGVGGVVYGLTVGPFDAAAARIANQNRVYQDATAQRRGQLADSGEVKLFVAGDRAPVYRETLGNVLRYSVEDGELYVKSSGLTLVEFVDRIRLGDRPLEITATVRQVETMGTGAELGIYVQLLALNATYGRHVGAYVLSFIDDPLKNGADKGSSQIGLRWLGDAKAPNEENFELRAHRDWRHQASSGRIDYPAPIRVGELRRLPHRVLSLRLTRNDVAGRFGYPSDRPHVFDPMAFESAEGFLRRFVKPQFPELRIPQFDFGAEVAIGVYTLRSTAALREFVVRSVD